MQMTAAAHTPPVELGDGYSYEADRVSQADWTSVLDGFSDASIYQAWPYDEACHPRSQSSRLVLKRGTEIVAVAQARVVMMPLLRRGIAYIFFGPVWRLGGQTPDSAVLRQCLRAVHSEYAVRRRLVVRILPRTMGDEGPRVTALLEDTGFQRCASPSTQRTILMDLSPPLDDLYAGLHQKWRNCLNSARKQPQQIVDGQDDDLFAHFATIYSAMAVRKDLDQEADISAVRRLQDRLPGPEKMTAILIKSGDDFLAGAVISAIGDVGIYLHGASAGEGLKNKSSYLVQWRAVELLKERQCKLYDLNGATREANSGTYRFKARLAGKQGREIERLGRYEACTDPLSRCVVRVGLKLQAFRR